MGLLALYGNNIVIPEYFPTDAIAPYGSSLIVALAPGRNAQVNFHVNCVDYTCRSFIVFLIFTKNRTYNLYYLTLFLGVWGNKKQTNERFVTQEATHC